MFVIEVFAIYIPIFAHRLTEIIYISRNVIIFIHTHTHTHTHTSKYIWICATYIRVVCFHVAK